MKPGPLVSIIIPTYNRAHLISETLDSILAQTYTHWECLVVDDGSTDNSQAVFESYSRKDSRFQFLKRPNTKPKGANTCRNIGLGTAKGEYIVFFDSDDLMTVDHLEVKINGMKDSGCDYVITRTEYFNFITDKTNYYYKSLTEYEISTYNYVLQKINWVTLDVCIKRELAKSIAFNEQLQSGQEYNYYCKLVHKSVNAIFIDKVVSLRRHHEDSIRSKLKTKRDLQKNYFFAQYYTYQDIHKITTSEISLYLLKKCIYFTFKQNSLFGVNKFKFFASLFKYFGFYTVFYISYFIAFKFFKKGYWFQSQFYKSLKKT